MTQSMQIGHPIGTIFTEHTPGSEAFIILHTPGDHEVRFDYIPGRVAHLDMYAGLFCTNHQFFSEHTEIQPSIWCRLAHVHCINRETDFTTGYFDAHLTILGDDSFYGRISNMTLEQACELFDRDDAGFVHEILNNRGNANKSYWPIKH